MSATVPSGSPVGPSAFANTVSTPAHEPIPIHCFSALTRHPPSVLTARVRMPPGSEPASGSVRPKQPTHSPLASFGRYLRFCSSDP